MLPERPSPEVTARRFRILAERWQAATGHLSSITQAAMHPAYQQIIGMGPDVVGLLLEELTRQPDHWFWALQSITGENPVPPPDQGTVPKMAAAWLAWGRQHGYRI